MSALKVFAAFCGIACGFFSAIMLADEIARLRCAWRRHRTPTVGADLARALGSAEQPAAAQPEAERPALRLVR